LRSPGTADHLHANQPGPIFGGGRQNFFANLPPARLCGQRRGLELSAFCRPPQETGRADGVEKWAVPGLRKLRPGLYSSAQPKSGRAGPLSKTVGKKAVETASRLMVVLALCTPGLERPGLKPFGKGRRKRPMSAKRTNNSSRGCPGAKRQAPPVSDSPHGNGPRKRSHFSLHFLFIFPSQIPRQPGV